MVKTVKAFQFLIFLNSIFLIAQQRTGTPNAIKVQDIVNIESTTFTAQGSATNEEYYYNSSIIMQTGYQVHKDLTWTIIRNQQIQGNLVGGSIPLDDRNAALSFIQDPVNQTNYPSITDFRNIIAGKFTGNNYGGFATTTAGNNGLKRFVTGNNIPRTAAHEPAHTLGVPGSLNSAHEQKVTGIIFDFTQISTGNSGNTNTGYTLGAQTGTSGFALYVYSTSASNSSANASNGGSGTIKYTAESPANGLLEFEIAYDALENTNGNGNTLDKIAGYYASGLPNSELKTVTTYYNPNTSTYDNFTEPVALNLSIDSNGIVTVNNLNVYNLQIPNTLTESFAGTYFTDEVYDAYVYNTSNITNDNFVAKVPLSELNGTDVNTLGLADGTYTFVVMAQFSNSINFSNTSTNFTISTLSVNENTIQDFKLYPNPANDELNISISGELKTVKLYDVNGKLVNDVKTNGKSEMNLDISNLTSGVYFINVTDINNRTAKQKFVKN